MLNIDARLLGCANPEAPSKGLRSRENHIRGTTTSLRTFTTPFFLLYNDEAYCSSSDIVWAGLENQSPPSCLFPSP